MLPLALDAPLGTRIADALARTLTAEERLQIRRHFHESVGRHFPDRQAERIRAVFSDPRRLDEEPVNELLALLVSNGARP